MYVVEPNAIVDANPSELQTLKPVCAGNVLPFKSVMGKGKEDGSLGLTLTPFTAVGSVAGVAQTFELGGRLTLLVSF